MRADLALFVLTLIANPLGIEAQGVGPLASELEGATGYLRDARFEVLLPSAQDPVAYDIALQSDAAPADTLSPCSYIIRWSATSAAGIPVSGFSAYFDGDHYRFRDRKLQEYHYAAMPAVFGTPGANSTDGVQRQAQFADLLPQSIGRKLRAMETDSSYIYTFHPDTIVMGRRAVAVKGVKRNNGYDAQNFLYAFDYDTHMPAYIDIETSPGTISEQLITVSYAPASEAAPVEMTEEALIAAYPEAFEKYRESTFRADNLVGNPMPDFSCPLLGSPSRFTHHHADGFGAPAIIVVIDPAVASAAQTIADMRQAAAQLPYEPTLILAFAANHSEDIGSVLGEAAPGEVVLSSAGSLVRNCGITLFPTIILASSDGTVHKVISGYNRELPTIVIQEASLLK